jgi:hypothetical protein
MEGPWRYFKCIWELGISIIALTKQEIWTGDQKIHWSFGI